MKSTITRERVQWLHDVATEFASTKLKMTMNPDEVLALTSALLAAMDSEPIYQYRIRNGYNGQVTEWQTIRPDQVDFVIKAQPINAEFRIIAAQQPAPVVPEEMPCGGAADDYHDGYQDGWNAFRAAMLQAGNSPVIPDTWIPVSERMPDDSSDVLCTAEFDGPGDWRKKVGYWHEGKWVVYGASWTPTHWMPLPAAPQEVR